MNNILANAAPAWLRRVVAQSWFPPLFLLAAALLYYGSYFRYWFNPHNEGGTACLLAQRLMLGERPWADVELGYNVGWFYPLVAIFKLTGVNYLAARAWFFFLSTVTAWCGYGITKRLTQSLVLSIVVGLALIALPGSQFKNYIPLAEAANLACLLLVATGTLTHWTRWFSAVALGGVVLGLTFLVRIELAFLLSGLWIALLGLGLLDHRFAFRRRLAGMLAAFLVLGFTLSAVQFPMYRHLRTLGVSEPFLNSYFAWFDYLETSLKSKFSDLTRPMASATTASAKDPLATPVPESPSRADENVDRSTITKRSLSVLLHGPWGERQITFLTYAPLLGFAVFTVLGKMGLLRLVFAQRFRTDSLPLKLLLLFGASATTFPQFYFFRSDSAHLSEFMPGYLLALACGTWMLWSLRDGHSRTRYLIIGWTAFAIFHFAMFAIFAWERSTTGTSAARKGRHLWFHAQNGVDVLVSARELPTLQGVYDAVMQHSQPGDYLVCYPYLPGYNLMTARATYLRNVYVSNLTRSKDWPQQTIQELTEKKPAIVVLDDRIMIGVEASRLSRWGAPVVDYVRAHYRQVGVFGTVEVFARAPLALSGDAFDPSLPLRRQ